MGPYPLITVAVVWTLGLALSHAYSYLPAGTGLLLAALSLWGLRAGQSGRWLYGLLLVAVLYGQYHTWHVAEDAVVHLAGQRVTLDAEVITLPHRSSGREQFNARVHSVWVDGQETQHSGLIRMTRRIKPDSPTLHYGDRFQARVTIRPISSLRNPHGFDYAAYQARQGILARASISSRTSITITPAPDSLGVALQRWRRSMTTHIQAALPRQPAALLTALAIGDTRALPDSLRERFQAAGMAHVLAISGTHLGLVAGLAFWLARLILIAFPTRWLTRLSVHLTITQLAGCAALLIVTAYACLSGGRVPTIRALIMVWMVMLALLSGRASHAPTGLAIAALIILLWDPNALVSASFQLSFCAVLAITLVINALPMRQPDAPPATRIKQALLSLIAVTVVAGAATAPLVVHHFGQVSWPGFFANLILVPVLGALILPVTLLAAAVSPLTDGLPWAEWCHLLLSGYIDATGWFATLPGALRHVPPAPGWLVLASYVGALGWVLGRDRLSRGTLPLGLVILTLSWWVLLHPTTSTGTFRVAFLDVGQGDAAVLIGPQGDTLVMDGGTRFGRFDTGRLVVAPYLWREGIQQADLLATHAQLDHAGGLIHLIPRFAPRAVYGTGERRPNTRFDNDFHAALAHIGLPLTTPVAGDRFAPLRDVTTAVLWPPPEYTAQPIVHPENNYSLVISARFGTHTFLFTADIEAEAEARLVTHGAALHANVIKVPHHGSNSSSSAPFIDATQAAVAVISVGASNRYGHPGATVLDTWQHAGAHVLRTDQVGAVLLESDGTTLRMTTTDRLTPSPVAPGQDQWFAHERLNWRRLFAPQRLWQVIPTPH